MTEIKTGSYHASVREEIVGDVVPSREVFRRACALHDVGQFEEAEQLLCDAILRDPANPDLRNARGVIFAAMGRHLDALWCYRDAIACNSNDPGIWTNLGNTLTHLKHLKSAVTCHQQALSLSSDDDALLYRNFGVSLAEARLHGDAVAAFTRALEIDADCHSAKWDRALSYLYLGNYRQGFADYEIRQATGQLPPRKLTGELWKGQPYGGKRLVILVEQGFGDTIWAARYLSRAKALGGELVVECQNELISLIGMGPMDQVIPRDEPLPDSDFYCYFCSLPGLFTSDFASIPTLPFLAAPHGRSSKFRALFDGAGSRLKVGVVWSGSTTFRRNQERAQSLLKFFQGFALPGVQLYSLQKGPPEAELRALPRGGPIVDLSPYIDDFGDTAAAISELDLVIMTDSSVAHLAGSMGKPVWILLGHVAHWLWLSDRNDSPWYPSVRLFRPRAEGDWDYVFDSASVELMKMVKLL
jgi:Flp pilus assembly protein TadD